MELSGCLLKALFWVVAGGTEYVYARKHMQSLFHSSQFVPINRLVRTQPWEFASHNFHVFLYSSGVIDNDMLVRVDPSFAGKLVERREATG